MATETKRRRGRPERPAAGRRRRTVTSLDAIQQLNSRNAGTDDRVDTLEGIQRGVADVKTGRTKPTQQVFARLRRVEFQAGGADAMTFKVSGPSAEHLRSLWSELGAVLTGRRTFDKAHGWDGNHAWGQHSC